MVLLIPINGFLVNKSKHIQVSGGRKVLPVVVLPAPLAFLVMLQIFPRLGSSSDLGWGGHPDSEDVFLGPGAIPSLL